MNRAGTLALIAVGTAGWAMFPAVLCYRPAMLWWLFVLFPLYAVTIVLFLRSSRATCGHMCGRHFMSWQLYRCIACGCVPHPRDVGPALAAVPLAAAIMILATWALRSR
jgi:hypothetical protein